MFVLRWVWGTVQETIKWTAQKKCRRITRKGPIASTFYSHCMLLSHSPPAPHVTQGGFLCYSERTFSFLYLWHRPARKLTTCWSCRTGSWWQAQASATYRCRRTALMGKWESFLWSSAKHPSLSLPPSKPKPSWRRWKMTIVWPPRKLQQVLVGLQRSSGLNHPVQRLPLMDLSDLEEEKQSTEQEEVEASNITASPLISAAIIWLCWTHALTGFCGTFASYLFKVKR